MLEQLLDELKQIEIQIAALQAKAAEKRVSIEQETYRLAAYGTHKPVNDVNVERTLILAKDILPEIFGYHDLVAASRHFGNTKDHKSTIYIHLRKLIGKHFKREKLGTYSKLYPTDAIQLRSAP